VILYTYVIIVGGCVQRFRFKEHSFLHKGCINIKNQIFWILSCNNVFQIIGYNYLFSYFFLRNFFLFSSQQTSQLYLICGYYLSYSETFSKLISNDLLQFSLRLFTLNKTLSFSFTPSLLDSKVSSRYWLIWNKGFYSHNLCFQ
jgi:hypothetical protein